MVGSTTPILLIVFCWAGSLLVCSTRLTASLVDTLHMTGPTAVTISVVVVAVFAATTWARIMAPDVAAALTSALAAVIVAGWVIASLRAGVPDTDALLVALLVPAWAVVTTLALVKLAVDGRGNTAHALYSFYDARGRKLYVGRTDQVPQRRFGQHAATKWWWRDVATREITYYPTRSALVAAERAEIIRSRPVHNKQHNGRRGARR